MNIALVHDYLREYGGAERVVEVLHEMWPEAPLYTSFVDWDGLGEHAYRFRNWDIRTSWVQGNWFVKKFISPLRFLAPKVWESFDLSGFDVVISSSGWFMCRGVGMKWPGPAARVSRDSLQFDRDTAASSPLSEKSIQSEDSSRDALTRVTRKSPLHICYIHHPPRNLYGYATGSTLQKYWPVRVYAAIINFFLRQYDFETAQRVDYFIANSKETARRVSKFYRRESTVIYPPIEISNFESRSSNLNRAQFLSVGRLTYSKRIDLAIAACNKLRLPLTIVGTGKEEAYLKSLAGPTITFAGAVSDSELNRLYSSAKALIFCALDEDFGMVPVEAMAHGTPVIALGQGGVLETVVDGQTGIIFPEPTVERLIGALETFNKTKKDWSKACAQRAETFKTARFKKELYNFVNTHTSQLTE